MSSWDRRAEIVRKIRALKGVAESTSFMGQREAAEAAAHDAGIRDGRAVQIEKGVPALTGAE